jgi:hypothetical protein
MEISDGWQIPRDYFGPEPVHELYRSGRRPVAEQATLEFSAVHERESSDSVKAIMYTRLTP